MAGFWMCVRMQLWKSSEYSRTPSMQGFCTWKRYTRFWICLNKAKKTLRQGSEYALSTFHRTSNKLPILNMVRLWIFEGYFGCCIWLNKPKYALLMSQYVWICRNNVDITMPAYNWKNRVLNIPKFWVCLMQYIL